jgi:hypothetical protein
METPKSIKYAVAWFRTDDWHELKQLCPDLQDTHDEWLANTRDGLKRMRLSEHDIDKVILTPDDLRAWRAANGREVNSQVRAQLAAETAMKREDTSH